MTFSYATESFEFEFRPVDPELHLDVLHAWLTHPNSAYWHMADITRQGLRSYMRNIAASEHEQGWMVFLHDSPVGYAEIYDPNHVLLADITEIGPGDLGIHLLTAPLEPGAPTLHGLTRALLLSATELCRSQGALRVVAEPDVSNTRIHAKNDLIGFQRIREVELPGKTALLSIKDFSVRQNLPSTEHLSRHYMEPAQRHLLAKAIAEFAHERLIHPNEVAPPADCPSAPWRPYHLPSQDCHYEFNALKLALHHWVIDESSLRRIGHNGEKLQLDTQEFIVEFHSELGIPDDLLSTYLEEIASTLASAAFKNMRGGVTASELAAPSFPVSVAADYQRTELTMTEGHPCFVASNGRIGFSLCDYMAYAPEAGNTLSYVWLAARKEHSALTLGAGVSDREHWLRELGPETLDAFNVALRDKGYEPDDFIYLPVHPWQFQHRVAVSFAPDIAAEKLVVLGETGDVHQPQQSIRTCFNRSDPHRSYVKTALSIQNMGFLRGQSAEFMKDAPAISDFVADIVRSDPFLSELGFDVLREHASVGYTGDAYHYPHMPDVRSAHRKMISVLWRESPIDRLEDGERLMSMTSLLHVDHRGGVLVEKLIAASGLPADDWFREYLRAYLTPLIHCLDKHGLAFMPHGENLIMRVREGRVHAVLMKDMGEEIGIMGTRSLPSGLDALERLRVDSPPEQAIFSDVFIGFFRHLAALMHTRNVLYAEEFWALVRENIATYQDEHGLCLDLFASTFEQCCHNRLQLKNTLSMVDLHNEADSLVYAGKVDNPIADSTA